MKSRILSWVLLGFVVVVSGCERRESGSGNIIGPKPAVAAPAPVAPPATTLPASVLDVPKPQSPEYMQIVEPRRQPIQIEVRCPVVAAAPVIDGIGNDNAWKSAPEIQTLDISSQRPITMRWVHSSDSIFLLASYPDAAPSITHKSWLWQPQEKVYKALGDREDMLVLKFSMVGNDRNISFRDAEPYRADVWFWKACRTNGSGYADDKWQALLTEGGKDTVDVPSPKSGKLYLTRQGDAGKAAYTDTLPLEYETDLVAGFKPNPSDGSRADIRAKGVWKDGFWTIEFSRKLNTRHDDDVQFQVGGTYLFGVSCYEMAYSPVDPRCFQPIYKTGDVFDRLMLRIDN
jgi:hypothetical protein